MYILVVDDEVEICDMIEMTIGSAFHMPIEIAYSGKQALGVIDKKGAPALIISDYRMPDGDGIYLFNEVKKLFPHLPFIVCSGDPLDLIKIKFPDAHGHLQKPRILQPMIQLLKECLPQPEQKTLYSAIRISHLLRLGEVHYDLYMKLSDDNYVKVIRSGESFLLSDAKRFNEKHLSHLYITNKDALDFLATFEANFELLMGFQKKNPGNNLILSLEAMDIIEKLGRTLGWRPEVVVTAKKCIDLAINTISTNPDILRVLKKQSNSPDTFYSQHAGPLVMVTTIFCQQLGWVSESSQVKLAMAALMHDMVLTDDHLRDVQKWNERARDSGDKSPETLKYRNHPIEAANLIQTIKNLPPDIDQIILQHHETPDATGFPRGLSSGWISPMSAVFIISEDLIQFISDSEDMRIRINEFVELREKFYVEGNFKRVFQALKANLMSLES